ncbi:hypothetical protein BH11VER1_BH11VER1_24330 [soil metagenome]
MQHVLLPEQFDALIEQITQIPGFTHEGVCDSISFPMWPAHEVVRRLPQDLMNRRRQRFIDGRIEHSGLDWRIFSLDSKQTLRKGSCNVQLVDKIALELSQSFTSLNFGFFIHYFLLVSTELGVIHVSINFSNYRGSKSFGLYWRANEGAIEAGEKNKKLKERYLSELSSFMAAQLANLDFPGCEVTDRVTSTGGDARALNMGVCWDSVLQIPLLNGLHSDALVCCCSSIKSGVEWPVNPQLYNHWAHLLEIVDPLVVESEGEFGFNWYGFPEVEPDWLELGSLAARLTPKRGPISVRLGDILFPLQGKSRGQLYAIRIDEGVLLSVKGGGNKLLALLSDHFNVPWVQGTSPVSIPKRLSRIHVTPNSIIKPVSFKKTPPFFKKATLQNHCDNEFPSEKFLQMLDKSGMFEGYPAEAREQAEEMIDASYRSEGDWQSQLISAIGFWKDTDDASGYLEEVIAKLCENSFGIFDPEELMIRFDDEEMPPEGDVRINYKLSGKSYRLQVECFYGSIPGELLPFIKESMEKSCHGVAWRQIFPEAQGSQALYYTLCTASALDQIKEKASAMS